ncbi:hypothetical protein N7516_008788 [Penicillium verrucosum]|uniref:uncharacterized protein n=1 Tax=Penicillium verrucosum TaxID=60171 RepID=UPI0025453E3F|nr:uncharacterized protein N7516_008788 [Penicillium verrucosum]KAJ5927015.1 hypothetical protein N7516_008788 [Penicillium verrucosum]
MSYYFYINFSTYPGDGEKTTIVRGLLKGNRGLFTQRSRWSIEYNSQVRSSALTGFMEELAGCQSQLLSRSILTFEDGYFNSVQALN